jgi:hypothetical protein
MLKRLAPNLSADRQACFEEFGMTRWIFEIVSNGL